MEYARKFDGVQAGHALRAGKLLAQYHSLAKGLPPREQYDATLAVCVLQSLLTKCDELLKYMKTEKTERQFFDQAIEDRRNPWGLNSSLIEQDTFPETLTLARFLEHLRNALSHPAPDEPFEFKPTGYTTTDNSSGVILAFRFRDSPWVKKGKRDYKGPLPLPTENEAKGKLKQFNREHKVDQYLEVVRQPDGAFELTRGGAIYWPVFEVVVPLPTLVELAVALANHLAQHTLEGWDKRTIFELVA
jgi:hypothetical protein